MSELRAREIRVQEAAPVPETDLSDLSEYLESAKDRRGHIRTPALQHILNLVSANLVTQDEPLEEILELSSGALESNREFEERTLLVRIAASLLLNDHAGDGFARDFGESIGKLIPHLLDENASFDFVSAVLNALVVAEALTENSIEVTADKLLSTWLLENVRLTKKHSSEETIAATVRALSLIASRAEDEPALSALLKQGLESVGSHPQNAATIVKAIGFAFETFGATSVVSVQFIQSIDDSQMTGSKEAKKEFSNTTRAVVDLMEKGSAPAVTLTFTVPGTRHSDVKQVEVDSVSKLAVLESVRALVGDQYYNSILTSTALHELFGLVSDEDRQQRAGRKIRNVKQPGDRRADLRDRTKGRGDARDRKHADYAGEE